jgi:regulatory protein
MNMKQSVPRPGRITKIEDQVRDPERVSVFIDDVFALGLSRRVYAQHQLQIGQELSATEIENLMLAEESERAWTAAVRLLAHRPRSRSEVETRLRRRQFSSGAIERACALLEDQGYLDDQDFARFWVENRNEHRPRGKRLLRQELRAKGIDDALVDQALDHSDLDESTAALEQARRRWEQLASLDPLVRKRRLTGFLQRRGYDWDVIRAVTDELESSDER